MTIQRPGPTISLENFSASKSSSSLLVARFAATMLGLKPIAPNAISLSPSICVAALRPSSVGQERNLSKKFSGGLAGA